MFEWVKAWVSLMFQSAPLTEAREMRVVFVFAVGLDAFQSAPLTEARGDSPSASSKQEETNVSIRSPDRSQGRCKYHDYMSPNTHRFNPLP